MKNLTLSWTKPIKFKSLDPKRIDVILDQVSAEPGVYIFGRLFGTNFEPRYVGLGKNVRSRLKSQLNNFSLLQHVLRGKNGNRAITVGYLQRKKGLQPEKALKVAEAALIRHFVASGCDLHNKQGIKIKKIVIRAIGARPKTALPVKLEHEI